MSCICDRCGTVFESVESMVQQRNAMARWSHQRFLESLKPVDVERLIEENQWSGGYRRPDARVTDNPPASRGEPGNDFLARFGGGA
jgi:hypothetical protein